MKFKKSISFTALLTFLCWNGLAHAQASTNAAGGDAVGSGGSVAFTVGQVDYTTNAGSSGIVAQGVQHPYEVFVVGIHESSANISLTVAPNPATENVTLRISDDGGENLFYEIWDLQGKELGSAAIMEEETQIEMKNLSAGSYLIHVVNQDHKKIQSFRIVKL
jgi:hypothetical protein